ncbi:MAG: hypothetical protein AAGA70_13825 [Pseudomonadota bacterium]
MVRRALIGLGLCLALAACESRLNPLNWFGGAREERISAPDEAPEAADPRPLVDQVVDLTIDPLPGGAVVTAVGLPPRQGFWQAELVEASREDGRLVYEFRLLPPLSQTDQGSRASREVVTATALSDQDLAQIREIVVQGQSNRLISRR